MFLISGTVLFLELSAMAIQMVVPALRYMAPTFPPAALPWVLTVTSLVGAALQPLGGKLSDTFGPRPVVLAMAAAFVVGSITCALTTVACAVADMKRLLELT